MRAFILRRLALITNGFGNVILLGSRHSADTLRLREFLSRNAYPYTYVDLDTDKDSQALLDRFEVKLSEIPVIICNRGNVLRNPTIAGSGRLPRLQREHRRRAGARRHHRGRRPVRPRRRCLCRFGRSRRSRDRSRISRRPGRIQLKDRKLSRLSHRSLRSGAGEPRPGAGAKIRRENDDRPRRRAPRLQRAAL